MRQTRPVAPSTRPLIGLTTYVDTARWGVWDVPAAVLHATYVAALQRAGARPILLPPDPGDDGVLDRLDGLVVTGGPDVDPRLDGRPASDDAAPIPERDSYELLLWHGARARDVPTLGICRGLQTMVLAHGGSLIPDLDDAGYGTAHREVPGTYTEHEVALEEGSTIAGIYGTTRMRVNSSHHQAIADPGSTVPTGWADDGVIEVCEIPEARFAIGVQWHPEHPDRLSADLPLLRALVEAASR